MTLTNLALRHRTSVVALAALLVVGGIASFLLLPKEEDPSIEVPYFLVTTPYPGANPESVEQVVTKPIEQEISSLDGVEEIRSTSVEGLSTVMIKFDPDRPVDDTHQKVRDKVDIATADFPSAVKEPVHRELDFSEMPVMTVNLAADYSLARLRTVAEDLQEEIENVSGVLEADLFGGREREVRIDVDLNALQGYHLAFRDVIRTIQRENADIPGGSVDVQGKKYSVRTSGTFDTPGEIKNLVVKVPRPTPGRPNPGPVYVRDVADVSFGFKDRTSYSRLQVFQTEGPDGTLEALSPGEQAPLPVVSLRVKKRSGENIIETVEAVRTVLDEAELPSGTRVAVTGDRSKYVRTLVKGLENNILSGLVLVVAVLVFFMGARNALLVGIAVPLSMFATFLVFYTLGYTLNFVILYALVLALGMLVDNAIVVVENIYRFREEGYSRFEAARKGTAEVGGPIIAATATTLAAFVPMLFWPGITGEFMFFLPLTLIVTLSCSLLVALVINPVLTGMFVKVKKAGAEAPAEASTGAGPETSLTGGTASSKRARRIGLGGIALGALVVAIINPITIVVLIVGGGGLYLLHEWVIKPVGDRFVAEGLPRLMASYRHFLHWMLERDYRARWAYPRNMLALGSLAGGAVGGLLGGLVMTMSTTAALLLLIPAGLLMAVGLLSVMVHTAEAAVRGRTASMKVGLAMAGFSAVSLALVALSGRAVSVAAWVTLLAVPLGVVLLGALGTRLKRRRLLLTDNRVLLMNASLGALLAIGGVFQAAPTGVEFFPRVDPSQIIVKLEAPPGTNLQKSNRMAGTVLERIGRVLAPESAARANVKNIVAGVGVGGDLLMGGALPTPARSRLTLNLVDFADRAEPSAQTMHRLRDRLESLPGLTLNIDRDQNGPPTGPPVNIEISGPDFDRLAALSQQVQQELKRGVQQGGISGLVDIRDNLETGKPQLDVDVDRQRAARFGLSSAQVARTVRTALHGTRAGTFRKDDDEYDITVRLAQTDRKDLESLRTLTIPRAGRQIPLVSVADLELKSKLGAITRKGRRRVVTVQGSTAPGASGPDVLAQVRAFLGSYEQSLPPGYRVQYTGASKDKKESFNFLTTALLVAVILIFLVLIAEFDSVTEPFIIILAVGLSLIGVLLGLILTRLPFGLMTFVGIIALAGIVVNNAIVLVDYIGQLRAGGVDKKEAIIGGGSVRLRPVLLTALTTVLGLIPLTLGLNIDFVGLLTHLDPALRWGSESSQFWGPMGTAIISGLLFATFLTLVIVPVTYSLFDSVSSRLRAV